MAVRSLNVTINLISLCLYLQVCFVVESVAAHVTAEVRLGDILVAVDGKKVTSMVHIGKFVKQSGNQVPIRLERRVKILPKPYSDDKVNINYSLIFIGEL